MRVSIVTDSCSGLPLERANSLNIFMVPGIVFVEEQRYLSTDLFPEDLKNIIYSGKNIRTATAPIQEFLKVYEKAYEVSDIIIGIHNPSQLSSINQVARAASRRLEDPSRVYFLEPGVGTLGLALISIIVAQLAPMYSNLEGLLQKTKKLCASVQLLGTIDSFEHLVKGGRIGRVSASLASVFSINPVLLMQSDDIILLGKPRGRQKALNTLIQKIKERINLNDESNTLAIGHFDRFEDVEFLKEKISSEFTDSELIEGVIDPMVAAHAGPGLVLVAFFGTETSEEGEILNA